MVSTADLKLQAEKAARSGRRFTLPPEEERFYSGNTPAGSTPKGFYDARNWADWFPQPPQGGNGTSSLEEYVGDDFPAYAQHASSASRSPEGMRARGRRQREMGRKAANAILNGEGSIPGPLASAPLARYVRQGYAGAALRLVQGKTGYPPPKEYWRNGRF